MSESERLREVQTLHFPNGSAVTFIADIDAPVGEVGDFYSAISDRCLDFCKSSIAERLDGRAAYLYKLRCRARGESELTVTLTVSLSNKTSRRLIFSHSETHVWLIKKGTKRAILSKRRAKKGAAEQG